MTAEVSNARPVLLDSRAALKKAKFLSIYTPVGIALSLAVYVAALMVIAKYSDPFKYSFLPAFVALGIIGSVVSFFMYKLNRELKKVTRDTEYAANEAITKLLQNDYSIKLREPVLFYSNPYVSRHSLNYISISKDPLSATDLKTDKPVRVILNLSPDRTDIEAAILAVAHSSK